MLKVVLVMFKDDERREFPLKSESTLIGRRSEAGLRIPTRDVSREHCRLQIVKNELRVRDLDSSNGTYVNGKRVDEAVLKPGDRLTVGPVNFIVQIDGKPAKIEATDAAPQLSDTDGAGAVIDLDEVGEEILDLDAADFDLDDATSEIQALLEDDEDDDDVPPTPPEKPKR